MSWRTGPAAIAARKVIRALGLRRPLSRLLLGRGYEEAFHQAMLGAIRPGDTVWDVGANVGYYTDLFARAAGPEGHVFAFEPSPRNLATLRAKVAGSANVTVVPYALGASSGVVRFEESDTSEDALGATSRISGEGNVEVEMRAGADVAAEGLAGQPNFIKIDVEGFESDVLRGLGPVLRDPTLRTVAVEVHFGLSASRGVAAAPAEVERIVAGAGLVARWTDPSHLVAVRP